MLSRAFSCSVTKIWLFCIGKHFQWTVIMKPLPVNCHDENMTKPYDYLVHKQWCQDFSFWWHWHFHWHDYLLLRNELSILSEWHAFAGYQLRFAVCTNCFEKCTNCCANVNSDVRNAPKRLRKTVIWSKPWLLRSSHSHVSLFGEQLIWLAYFSDGSRLPY